MTDVGSPGVGPPCPRARDRVDRGHARIGHVVGPACCRPSSGTRACRRGRAATRARLRSCPVLAFVAARSASARPPDPHRMGGHLVKGRSTSGPPDPRLEGRGGSVPVRVHTEPAATSSSSRSIDPSAATPSTTRRSRPSARHWTGAGTTSALLVLDRRRRPLLRRRRPRRCRGRRVHGAAALGARPPAPGSLRHDRGRRRRRPRGRDAARGRLRSADGDRRRPASASPPVGWAWPSTSGP